MLYFGTMKTEVLAALAQTVDLRLDEAMQRQKSLQEALVGESKSTAGDKHETGRAMIHLEMEQVQGTLDRLLAQKDELNRLGQSLQSRGSAVAGTLVETDGAWVFVGLALGKLEVLGQTVLAVSAASPLALTLREAGIGDQVPLGSGKLTVKDFH